MQRVEQGHGEAGVGGVVVARGGLVGEAEPAVVESDHPVARGGDGFEVLAARVHRGAETVDEDDGRTVPRVDVAQRRAVDREVPGGEAGPGRKPARLGDRGGAAGRNGEPAHEQSVHARLRSAARTTARIAGCELQIAVTPSPAPLAATAWPSSMSRIVGVSTGTLAATSVLASTGTSPATRSSRVARSRARRQAGSDGRSSSAASTPSTRRSEEHTSELQSQSNLVCRLLLEKK